jgi:hypothetical protein
MANVTRLNRYYTDDNNIYTHDSWIIPEEGTEIWYTWGSCSTIVKPYGDGYHFYAGDSVYHCDELMRNLENWQQSGHSWGLHIPLKREQRIKGEWRDIKIKDSYNKNLLR